MNEVITISSEQLWQNSSDVEGEKSRLTAWYTGADGIFGQWRWNVSLRAKLLRRRCEP
ncbi:cadherin-like domain-containing protein [Vibrio chagasii]|nr:cadherin-like domain-containing protein [Vibrio chagasii]